MKPLTSVSCLLPLALLLAACGPSGRERAREFNADGSAIVAAAPGAGEEIDDALLLLPIDAGPVARLRERHYANGTRQEIVMRGESALGDNVIEVAVRTESAVKPAREGLQIGPPDERGVRMEIAGRFPNMRMHVVTRPMNNGFGPMGLAIGAHPSGGRCAFAWQWIPDLREAAPGASNLEKVGSLLSLRSAPASVRIRLCHKDMNADQLAATIEALGPGAPRAFERVFRLDRRNLPGGGAPSAPAAGDLIALPTSLESVLAGAVPVRAPQAAPKAARKPAAKRVARKPARPPAPAEATRAAAEEPVGWRSPDGPRYLAPVGGSAAGVGVSSETVAVIPTAPRVALPPQAYQGPRTAGAWGGAR